MKVDEEDADVCTNAVPLWLGMFCVKDIVPSSNENAWPPIKNAG
eukprot:COSAG02_NODE_52685_length_306_cov_0.903382_1_plen_43_part_10